MGALCQNGDVVECRELQQIYRKAKWREYLLQVDRIFSYFCRALAVSDVVKHKLHGFVLTLIRRFNSDKSRDQDKIYRARKYQNGNPEIWIRISVNGDRQAARGDRIPAGFRVLRAGYRVVLLRLIQDSIVQMV